MLSLVHHDHGSLVHDDHALTYVLDVDRHLPGDALGRVCHRTDNCTDVLDMLVLLRPSNVIAKASEPTNASEPATTFAEPSRRGSTRRSRHCRQYVGESGAHGRRIAFCRRACGGRRAYSSESSGGIDPARSASVFLFHCNGGVAPLQKCISCV